MSDAPRLTEYSHGAGCGCKLSPKVLQSILARAGVAGAADARLIVGTDTRDDAAVFDLGDGTGLISTTDFFMPIVDDPHDFGRVAATNAISDVYAMGGTPLCAIAILGWPVEKLAAEVAGGVVEGGRRACREAGIALAGGHSIDCPEPIFGLAVSGRVELAHLKRNSTAEPGCGLWLTKPIGVGILTTAEKRRTLRAEHRGVALASMTTLNKVGARLGPIDGVSALTDVTGLGLLGHLIGMCEGSRVRARVDARAVPLLPGLDPYLAERCWPGGTERNWDSYGAHVASASGGGAIDDRARVLLCDPQTSGGLLAAVRPAAEGEFLAACRAEGVTPAKVGEVLAAAPGPLVLVQ
jgi:selenide,water dikinase